MNVFKLVWRQWVAQCSCTTSKNMTTCTHMCTIIKVNGTPFASCCIVSSPPWSYLPVILLLSHFPTVITYLGEWYLGYPIYTCTVQHVFPPPSPPTPLLFATSRPVIWLTVRVVVVPSGLWAQDPFIRWYDHLQHMVCIAFLSNSTRSSSIHPPHSNPIGISWCCAYSLLMLTYCVFMHIRTHHARTYARTHKHTNARTHARTQRNATHTGSCHSGWISIGEETQRWLCTMYGNYTGRWWFCTMIVAVSCTCSAKCTHVDASAAALVARGSRACTNLANYLRQFLMCTPCPLTGGVKKNNVQQLQRLCFSRAQNGTLFLQCNTLRLHVDKNTFPPFFLKFGSNLENAISNFWM